MVYVISYEECCSGQYSSGVSYVLGSKEKAERRLEEIKQDEINYYLDNGRDDIKDLVHDLISEDGFIIDFIDDYTKYVITEEVVENA